MTIKTMIKKYEKSGLKYADALAKTCQDIMLSKIANSEFGHRVTIKGGVVLMNISNDNRRATRDLDLDFIRYSIDDNAIIAFIEKLNMMSDGIKIGVYGKIKSLNQDDYKGKRVFVSLSDNDIDSYEFKIDLGIHTNLDLEQDELCFDLNSSFDSVTLLANSKEQIVAEKLKSVLKHGVFSTRFKDVFDIYYLTTVKGIDKEKFKDLIADYILKDYRLRIKNFTDLSDRLNNIFLEKNYRKRLELKEDNWLDLPVDKVIKGVLDFFMELELVEV